MTPISDAFRVIRLLEVEVALAVGNLLDVLAGDFAHAGVLDLGQLLIDEDIALGNGVLAGEVHEVLLERHERIGCADVANLAALAQFHEAVTRAARTVAGGAEAGDIADAQ